MLMPSKMDDHEMGRASPMKNPVVKQSFDDKKILKITKPG